MRKKDKKWNEKGEHYILFMDIMGFKERVLRTNHNDLYKILKNFKNKNNQLKPLLNGKDDKELLRITQFSDSIIIATLDSRQKSLYRLILASIVLMHNALETSLPIKGAISKGKLTFEKEEGIYFGLSLTDAYLFEEELKFYGVAFHHTVEKDLIKLLNKKKNGKKNIHLPVKVDKIPLKSGSSCHNFIDYSHILENLSEGDISYKIKEWLNKIKETVSGAPRIYIDNTVELLNLNRTQE